MYIKLTLLLVIYHLNVIFGEDIYVSFDNIIVLDNSTINWISDSEINETICFPPTTINLISTLITTIEPEQDITTLVSTIQSSNLYTCADGSYGVYCNVSSDACDVANSCLNGATCYSNSTLSVGYYCQCASGYSGDDCESDDRICTDDTCWNDGTCIVINITDYKCQCVNGYEGANCQLVSDMCDNVTCENNGICVSSYLKWSCECIDSSLYSGTYCQDKSSSLVIKQAISRSLAIIAIIALCCVVGFIIIMDILKYVFKIDPVDREHHRLRMEKEKEEQKNFKKKKVKKTKTPDELFYAFI